MLKHELYEYRLSYAGFVIWQYANTSPGRLFLIRDNGESWTAEFSLITIVFSKTLFIIRRLDAAR